MNSFWPNIQHLTFNIEHRMGCRVALRSALKVEGWVLNVLASPGGLS